VQAQYPGAYEAQQVDQVATPAAAPAPSSSTCGPLQWRLRTDRALCRPERRGGGAQRDVAAEAIQQATAAYDFAMNVQVMPSIRNMKTLLDVQV